MNGGVSNTSCPCPPLIIPLLPRPFTLPPLVGSALCPSASSPAFGALLLLALLSASWVPSRKPPCRAEAAPLLFYCSEWSDSLSPCKARLRQLSALPCSASVCWLLISVKSWMQSLRWAWECNGHCPWGGVGQPFKERVTPLG